MEKIAKFEKISREQFGKDVSKMFPNLTDASVINNMYDSIQLPIRSTSGSAGYDFAIPFATALNPGQDMVIPSGIRCAMTDGWVLMLYPRSSLGFKYHMTIANTVPIIDADYFYAENEGHIMIKIRNDGDKVLELKGGDRFVQGIFLPYGITLDDNATSKRTGGIGSTNK